MHEEIKTKNSRRKKEEDCIHTPLFLFDLNEKNSKFSIFMEQTTNRRDWRKLVKKLQRKRRRQKFAQQRDKELEEAELEKLKDPLYKTKMEQQEQLEQQQQMAEDNEHQLQEELWLRRELLAQQQFKRDELKRQEEEAKLVAELIKKEEELKRQEEVRRKKREELNLRAEKEAKEFEELMVCMQEYLEDSSMKTPERLDRCMETKPGEKPCEFFLKTNSCRFGSVCTFNHKRPLLAKTILIRHFFQHPLLEQQKHEEYSRSDSELELSERDLRDAYDEFCGDVWPVLEDFGTIINFRAVRNVQSHFRGNVFVEYADKRSALKAFMNLHNRYYASKRLNVEFSNIRAWRTGVCGMRSVYR
ncbi:U2 small nuclear ribonucleoprotein auxiliary factor 35 kDa subunit-related protein 2 isoform X2 [Lucilia sericata]|uniref:U2 small nuclear ribonucleoprotein auxiliary factor 35 kDa subunit-related protein 2 isoform X2 n=1 Tax=Lucilia sericata TaxID=13632 RepID=UPI0018A8512D|nr:U2 small nuclear ribonucleoprotein auxiliary factor 35 kDa subunit-related protein 2 isoform X2 [Lucilia sericata]